MGIVIRKDNLSEREGEILEKGMSEFKDIAFSDDIKEPLEERKLDGTFTLLKYTGTPDNRELIEYFIKMWRMRDRISVAKALEIRLNQAEDLNFSEESEGSYITPDMLEWDDDEIPNTKRSVVAFIKAFRLIKGKL